MGQDPAQGIAGPDLGASNFLQRLSVEDTRIVGKV